MALENFNRIGDAEEDPFFVFQQMYIDGDDEQKLGVVKIIPHLLQFDLKGTIANVLLRIQKELPKASSEFNVNTSEMFKVLIEKNNIPPTTTTVDLMQSVYGGVESRNTLISSAWVETLVSVGNVLSESQIKNEVLPIANRMASETEITEYRQECGKILGNVAVHPSMGPLDVKREILPLVHGLCQDFDSQVRSSICSQLPLIAQGLGRSLVKSYLLPNLIELSADDSMNVRAAAIEAVANIFPHVNEDTVGSVIVPLVKQLCERSLHAGDTTRIVMAREMGKVMDGLIHSLNESDAIWFLFCFKELCSTNTDNFELIRRNCATSLPSLTRFVLQVIPAELQVLKAIMHDLVMDESIIVRQIMASNMQEIARILGCDNAIIEEELVILLTDESEQVVQLLVANLGSTLEMFFQKWGVPEETTLNITEALHKCQAKISQGLNWRLKVVFIQQLESLPNCISSDFIYHHFAPEVLDIIVKHGPRPVRIQAAHTLLIFLRFNTDNEQKKELRDQLRRNLAQSEDCYSRIIFVQLCIVAMDLFSDRYFKNYFFKSLVGLANDPVVNVRLCVLNVLSRLPKMIRLPTDITLKQQLDVAIKSFEMETDRDIKELHEKFKSHTKNGLKSREQHDVEEKRRQDEENWIDVQKQKPKTRKVPIIEGNRNSNRSNSLIQGSMLPNKVVNSLQNSDRPSNLQSGGMNFLKQHFYIDAGVNLPLSTANIKNATNITDDEKVNLRKKTREKMSQFSNTSSSSIYDLPSKRYSSIISTACLKNQTSKSLQRRSLDFSYRDASKIPISNSSSPIKDKISDIRKQNKLFAKENCCMDDIPKIGVNNNSERYLRNTNVTSSKSLSQLPVFVGKFASKK